VPLVLVCQCHRVSDKAVSQVVEAGASKVGQVVRGTKAGTDCGGCLPQLRRVCEAFFAARDHGSAMLSATG
jgi:bacterioferritin-associated ferredoxin